MCIYIYFFIYAHIDIYVYLYVYIYIHTHTYVQTIRNYKEVCMLSCDFVRSSEAVHKMVFLGTSALGRCCHTQRA